MTCKPSILAKYWVTSAGLQAAVVFTRQKFYCGYVGVPKGHPLFGLHYDNNTPYLAELKEDEEIGQRGILTVITGADRMQSPSMVFDVHGSITFSDSWKAGTGEDSTLNSLNDGLWYFGYDCAHAGDGEFPDIDEEGNIVPDPYGFSFLNSDQPKSLDFNIQQCESLAAQIVAKTLPMLALEDKSNDPA